MQKWLQNLLKGANMDKNPQEPADQQEPIQPGESVPQENFTPTEPAENEPLNEGLTPSFATHQACGVKNRIGVQSRMMIAEFGGVDDLYCMHEGKRFPVAEFELS